MRLTERQLELLEETYIMRPYPSRNEEEELSRKIKTDPQSVRSWFNNRRRHQRRLSAKFNTSTTPTPMPQLQARENARFSSSALDYLIKKFDQNAFPGNETMAGFAEELGVSVMQVHNWFCKRRQSAKEKGLRVKLNKSLSLSGSRSKFTPEQLRALLDAFEEDNYPGAAVHAALGEQLGLTEIQVCWWFAKRRRLVKIGQGTRQEKRAGKAIGSPIIARPIAKVTRSYSVNRHARKGTDSDYSCPRPRPSSRVRGTRRSMRLRKPSFEFSDENDDTSVESTAAYPEIEATESALHSGSMELDIDTIEMGYSLYSENSQEMSPTSDCLSYESSSAYERYSSTSPYDEDRSYLDHYHDIYKERPIITQGDKTYVLL